MDGQFASAPPLAAPVKQPFAAALHLATGPAALAGAPGTASAAGADEDGVVGDAGINRNLPAYLRTLAIAPRLELADPATSAAAFAAGVSPATSTSPMTLSATAAAVSALASPLSAAAPGPLSPASAAFGAPTYNPVMGAALPAADGLHIQLPSAWNQRDKCGLLELKDAHQRVDYTGPGRSDTDAAAVRANYPIPMATGIYYYEVQIVSKGREGYISVGFCAQGVALNRLPGWEQHSWGYHGDDGNIFQSSGSGKAYGPTFTTGDVIGCGINFAARSAFFTKNGVNLGTAFTNLPFPTTPVPASGNSAPISKPLYPAVGMRTPGEVVAANFGHAPFKFDIAAYAADLRAAAWDKIVRPNPAVPDPSVRQLTDLVLGYLVHHGYKKTAAALLRQRQKIAASSASAPESPSSAAGASHGGDAMDVDGASAAAAASDAADVREQLREMEQRAAIREAILDGDMDRALAAIDAAYPAFLDRHPETRFALQCQKFVELVAASLAERDAASATGAPPAPLLAALDYGRRTLAPYGHDTTSPTALPAELVQPRLLAVFSLVAYADPRTVPVVAPLLDPAQRALLAERVNGAIQVGALGRPARPALEAVACQTRAAAAVLAARGIADAPLVNVAARVFGGL
ncbi:hypothetical protein H9P43_003880 [Blastocladiella emersonii ATCC 22665]|nr:hypothetical protein H9P43_003880 [Blastocladiella emersonii ATCC 22665]